MFLFDQRSRLLRESWTADSLAQEVYAMFAPDTPANTAAPVLINQPANSLVAPIQIPNPGNNQPIFNLTKPGGAPYGQILFQNGQFVFVQPNGQSAPMCCAASTPPTTLTFIQQNYAQYGSPGTTFTLAYSANVTKNDLLIVAVNGAPNGTGSQHVTVADSLGNTYAQIASYSLFNSGNISISLWYTVANASGPNTVTVTNPNNPFFAGIAEIGLLEYSGVSALDSAVTVSHDFFTAAGNRSTGTFTVSASNELALGGFFIQNGNVTFGAAYNVRIMADLGGYLTIVDIFNPTPGATILTGHTPGFTLYDGSIGASFK